MAGLRELLDASDEANRAVINLKRRLNARRLPVITLLNWVITLDLYKDHDMEH